MQFAHSVVDCDERAVQIPVSEPGQGEIAEDDRPGLAPVAQLSNSNGDVRYRVIDLLGTRFVQWRGGMNISYPGGSPRGSGRFLRTALPATARPSSGLRTLPTACSSANSSILTVKVDFHSNGTATLLSDTGDAPP